MKLCMACGESKPLEEFHRNRRAKDGLQSRCKPCHIAGVTAAIRKNPKRHLAQTNKWRDKNREKVQAAARARRRRSLQRIIDRDNRLNRAELKARAQVVNAERYRLWRLAHPERVAELARRSTMAYIARKRGAKGHATADQIAARWAYYGGKCWMCGAPAEHTDHVIPLNRGGTDWASNQRPACARCNIAKRDRDHREFLARAV